MSHFVLYAVILVAVLLVFHNWLQSAGERRRLHWKLPVYRVLPVRMPFPLPIYFYLSRWWEVEPKLFRAASFGIWAIYLLPRNVE